MATKTKTSKAKVTMGVTVISAPPPPKPEEEMITIQIVATRTDFRDLLDEVSSYSNTIGTELHDKLGDIVFGDDSEDRW